MNDVGERCGQLFFTKLQPNGDVIINDKEIKRKGPIGWEYCWPHAFEDFFEVCIDKNNNLHILSVEPKRGVWHTVLDPYGTTIKEFNLTSYMNDAVRKEDIKIHIGIDKNDNIYLLWDNKAYPEYIEPKRGPSRIRYLKQLDNGAVAINTTLVTSPATVLRAKKIVSDIVGNTYIFWCEYDDCPGLYNSICTYMKKFDLNGTDLYTKEIPNMQITDVKIDYDNNIHILGTTGAKGESPDNDKGVYVKLDGDVILGPTRFTNKMYDRSGRLAVDSNGNVHIV